MFVDVQLLHQRIRRLAEVFRLAHRFFVQISFRILPLKQKTSPKDDQRSTVIQNNRNHRKDL